MVCRIFRWILIAILVLIIFSSVCSSQENESVIKIDENELKLNGLAGQDGLNATIHIKETGGKMDIQKMNVYSYDLIDDLTGKRITADQIKFDKNGFDIPRTDTIKPHSKPLDKLPLHSI